MASGLSGVRLDVRPTNDSPLALPLQQPPNVLRSSKHISKAATVTHSNAGCLRSLPQQQIQLSQSPAPKKQRCRYLQSATQGLHADKDDQTLSCPTRTATSAPRQCGAAVRGVSREIVSWYALRWPGLLWGL